MAFVSICYPSAGCMFSGANRGLLADLIYSAMEDPSRWKDFLDGFAEAMQARQSLLVISYAAYPESAIVTWGGAATEEDHRIYREQWAAQDPWVSQGILGYEEGLIVPSQDLCPDEILEQTAIYREYLSPRCWHYGGGVCLARGPKQIAVHTTVRSKALGPLQPDELEFWRSLIPHLIRAVKMQGILFELRAEHSVFGACFEQHSSGLLLTNQRGIVFRGNRKGLALLTKENGLILKEQQLRATERSIANDLEEAIDSAGYPGPADHPKSRELLIDRGVHRRPLLLIVSPLAGQAGPALGTSQSTVVIELIDPESGAIPDPVLLQRLFDLTPAEATLCCRLASGLTVEESSEALHVSVNTVRTHLKRTLEKTGTRRQAELVSLLHRVATQRAESRS